MRLRRVIHVFLLVPCLWIGGQPGVQAQIRSAKVAGAFYPDDRSELLELVTDLVKRQPEAAAGRNPRILIVPHAGYQYSGLVAGNGFRQLQGHRYDGVVVVGFTHQMPFTGSSVDTVEAYETPIGVLPVDQEASAILRTYPGIGYVEAVHDSSEHSLEVELPFLQVALERPRIIPVLMGGVSLAEANRLADALAGLSRLGDYLFVFSTDLSHYHSHDEAQRIDEGTIHALLSETPQAVSRLFQEGTIEACGQGPIVTSLLLAQRLGYLQPKLLYQANSGDTWGNPSKVVGYAAIGMYERAAPKAARVSTKAGRALVQASRVALEEQIEKRPPARPIKLDSYPELGKARGVFVTLRKAGQLRGCIGRIRNPESLAQSIREVALDAALHDPRFAPVSAQELPQLHVEVSVLTEPVAVATADDIVPGRDGVILSADGHSGVFLPQVWDETGWTRLEFLRELASQKAGLSPDAWQHASLFTFQAQVFQEPPH